MVCTSQPPKIQWKTSVQAWSISLNSLKTNIFAGLKYFFVAINQFQTMQNLHLWRQEKKKIFFCSFEKKKIFFALLKKKKILYLLNDSRI